MMAATTTSSSEDVVVADIYTDGSCVDHKNYSSPDNHNVIKEKKKKRVAGSGVYWKFISNHHHHQNQFFETEISELVPPCYNQTNQVAELYAILLAVRQINKFLLVVQAVCQEEVSQLLQTLPFIFRIFSDSQYSINCLTVWYKTWQRNGFRNSKNDEVVNKQLIIEILAELEPLRNRVSFHYVKGHSNIDGNVMADRLACLATKQKE